MIDVDEPTLLKLLSERMSMVDSRLFVGRRDAIRLLADTQLAWIYGPGRTGKSSLARRLVEGRGRIAWIDTGDVADGDLNEALRRVAAAAGVESENPRMGYERVMRSGVLGAVVFDEFDSVAVNLDGDAQAFLRRLLEECRETKMVVVTRSCPADVVEEVSDKRSRLVGIAITRELSQFERADVDELLDRTRGLREWTRAVWTTVGGHPVSVMTVVQVLVHLAMDGKLPSNSARLPAEVDRSRGAELEGYAKSLWRDLPPGLREFLLDASNPPELRSIADRLGYVAGTGHAIRPARLLELGKRLGPHVAHAGSDARSVVDAIDEAVYSINRIAVRRFGRFFFQSTNESNGRFILSRRCQDAAGLMAVVNHFYMRFYEGAKDHCRDGPPDPRLPPRLWESAKPWRESRTMRRVCALRHDFDHDQGLRGSDRVNRDSMEVGRCYRELCGRELPHTAAEWTVCRDRLVSSIGQELDDLRGSLAEPDV